jgi:hypothetical protein
VFLSVVFLDLVRSWLVPRVRIEQGGVFVQVHDYTQNEPAVIALMSLKCQEIGAIMWPDRRSLLACPLSSYPIFLPPSSCPSQNQLLFAVGPGILRKIGPHQIQGISRQVFP